MERTFKLGLVLYGTTIVIVLIRLVLLLYEMSPFSYLPFFLLLMISLGVTGRYLKVQKELERYQLEEIKKVESRSRFRRV